MPKASKVGKFRAAAKALSSRDAKRGTLTAEHLAPKKEVDAITEAASVKSEDKEALSRGQRKKLAKRERYLKREKMIMSSLRLRRLEEQKGKLDGLDAIREALGEAASSSPSIINAAKEMMAKKSADDRKKKLVCSTNKSKKNLANAEISHLGLVLQHPSFKEDPFAAIQQHLSNSLAPEAELMEQKSKERNEEDGKIEAKEKEERKERLREARYSKKKKKGSFKSSRAQRL